MFWILHGEDEFRRSEFIARLKADMGDPTMADVNTTVLDGRRVTIGQLMHAVSAVPFLGNRRLVVVEGLLARLSSGKKGEPAGETGIGETSPGIQKQFVDSLVEHLPRLPDTTWLVFSETQTMTAHPLRSLVQGEKAAGKAVEFRPFGTKKDGGQELMQWIRERASSKGLDLAANAQRMLATCVGNDLRLLDGELEKLAVFAAGSKVTDDDVRNLVPSIREADVFELVDALGRGDVRQATLLTHQMLDEGKAPLYLLSMFARQFRIMIQVKDLAAQRMSEAEIARETRLHEFVVKKGLNQARAFSFEQLEGIYQSLASTDEAIKTGKLAETLALDLFIAEVCRVAKGLRTA